MPELLVSHQGRKYFSAVMRTGHFTIGRSRENDLVLTGDDVSRRHLSIEKSADGYRIVNESLEGTLLNGERLTAPSPLKTRDKISVASWLVEFCERSDDAAVFDEKGLHPASLTDPITKIAKTPSVILDGSSLPMPTMLIVRDPSGAHARYPARKKSLTVGSAAECDIVILDEYVSRRHVNLSMDDGGFTVRDLNSTNGTFIDGARIREAFLTGDREISLGESSIRVCFKKTADDGDGNGFFGIIGESLAMRMLFTRLTKISATNMPALVLGPTGSGKERAASVLHELSARSDRPFVTLNCAAIAPGLLESEFFGHEKGAFTGAVERHAGAFEQAHTGTLFLDEIGELPLPAQAQLLRAIEYGCVRRVGGVSEVSVDVRIIAATHRNLAGLVAKKLFREDLFYRLYVLPIDVPPLRYRGEDIIMLAKHFLGLSGRAGVGFENSALEKLRAHDWPGNVRELRNTILRAAALSDGMNLKADDLTLLNPPRPVADGLDFVTDPVLFLAPKERSEAERIRAALKEAHDDKTQAATTLGMGRSTLFRRMKVLGI